MKYWKYCRYTDINMGLGMQDPSYYIYAKSAKEALSKLVNRTGASRITLNMEGRILPTDKIVQPKPIPVVK